MPKRRDENQTAFDGLQEILRRDAERDGIPQEPAPKPEKVPSAVRAGRLGGLKGGTVRAQSLSAKRRKQIAKKGARARWHKDK